MNYPDRIEIKPLVKIPQARLRVPGSKSITNRALVLAALTTPPGNDVTITGALESEDTAVMIDSLRRLGFAVEEDASERIRLARPNASAIIPKATADLWVSNSGTSMRFLTALVALGTGRYRLDGSERMRERPIADLLSALEHLGVSARSLAETGCPPVEVQAAGLRGGNVRIHGGISSQFLSGLLMVAPFAECDLDIHVEGTLVSVPYVEMTARMLRQFGCVIEPLGTAGFHVPAPQQPKAPKLYDVEPDASAASYFFGAAAITGGTITIDGLSSNSLQGDVRFVDVLERMGCRVTHQANAMTVTGGTLTGVDVDMNAISDTVMTLGAVACFAHGPTVIRNVGHIRHKETDRLAALATELRRVGVEVTESADALEITPRPLKAATIQTYNDHRMAMSLALVGLKVAGIVIDSPVCVAKTYPRFFDDLEQLRQA